MYKITFQFPFQICSLRGKSHKQVTPVPSIANRIAPVSKLTKLSGPKIQDWQSKTPVSHSTWENSNFFFQKHTSIHRLIQFKHTPQVKSHLTDTNTNSPFTHLIFFHYLAKTTQKLSNLKRKSLQAGILSTNLSF